MNYGRGRQMVIHDPRLNNPLPPPNGTPLRPPAAWNTWTVDVTRHSIRHVIGWAGTVATGAGPGGLDALHIMAHGNQSFVQLGTDNLTAANSEVFSALTGKVRVIVFSCCLVGSDTRGWYWRHPVYYGQRVAEITRARVVVARENQIYSWNPTTTLIDFGDCEGPVDVYSGSTVECWQEHNPFRATPRFDLERLIFG